MLGRQRQAHDSKCRDFLQNSGDRLDRLRSLAERSAPDGREELERALDALRGQHNRLAARVEAARMANDDAWAFARASVDQAVEEVTAGLDSIEFRLNRAAA